MSWTSNRRPPSRAELRSFGLVLGACFLVVGMVPWVFRHSTPGRVVMNLGLAIAAAGILVPKALRHVHRVWMTLGDVLGWINSRILLASVFYFIVTPVRVAMSLVGNDPMKRKFDATAVTYRVVRKARDVSHMRHQF